MPPSSSSTFCLLVLAIGTWFVPPLHAQRVWTGGGAPDTSWTNAANWGGTAPVAGDSITFTASTNTSTVNSFAADTTFNSIVFDNSANAGAFSLGGNRITLAGNISTTGGTGSPSHAISLDLLLAADQLANIGNGNSLTISGTIGETGGMRSFSKVGAGTLTLTAENTFTGEFVVRQGVTVINSIADAGVVSSIGAGSTFRLGQGSQSGILRYVGDGDTTNRQIQVGINGQPGHTGSGTILNDGTTGALVFTNSIFNISTSGIAARSLTLGGTNTNNNEVQGRISNYNTGAGVLSIIKEGTGTWILSGDNTYIGATTVSEGILIVNGDQAAATGAITVASGATLGGDGTLGGDTVIRGSLSTGGSAATGTVGSLAFASKDVTFEHGSVWLIDLVEGTNNSDQITGITDLTIDGTVNLTFNTTGTFDGTEKYRLATYSGLLTGTFANYADDTVYTIGTGSYRFDYNDGGAITLTAVPEPGTIGLLSLGLGGLIWRSRRRRNSPEGGSKPESLDSAEKVWQTKVDCGDF